MKKHLIKLAAFSLLAGTSLTWIGCSDYDDDIDSLNKRLEETNASLSELRALIEAGSVITDVQSTENGVVIKLSNGQSYTLTNGKDGQDGADAAVWTIGKDGYWYKNDEKTEFLAQGPKGDKGDKGEPGDAATGSSFDYYVPGADGYFDIYNNGQFKEDTQLQWKADNNGISAVLNGNILKLTGVEGAEGEIEILLGAQLGSIEFVPDVMSSEIAYPTTTDEFFHIATYLSESKFKANKEFIPQTDWDKSNEVGMVYRMNPTNAYVENAAALFLNRSVSTRAFAGDRNDLLNIIEESLSYGEAGDIKLKATINARKMSAGKTDIAALQVWAGQNPVTSDYIHAKSTAIDVVLANAKTTVAGQAAEEFYARGKKLQSKGEETDAFVKEFVGNVGENDAHFAFKYDKEIDLKPLAALYSNSKQAYLSKLGFSGMRYEFSLPENYKADDDQKTNQQWFVEMTDGVVKANRQNLGETTITPAIGRTPIVRVDAFMTSNAGNEVLVASAYIKLSIERNDPTVDPGQDLPALNVEIDKELNNKGYGYRALDDEFFPVAEMPWTEINKQLYGQQGLTSEDFWANYGGENNTYVVKVEVAGQALPIFQQELTTDTAHDITDNGIRLQINLNDDAETTSSIKIAINNEIKTQHSYKDVSKKGAEYTVTLTIKADDRKEHNDYVLTQKFYVKDECTKYTFNNLYHFTPATIGNVYEDFDANRLTAADAIVVKGQLNDQSQWEMSSVISEHFAKRNGLELFSYYQNDPIATNVTALDFEWKDNTGVSDPAPKPMDATSLIALTEAMEESYLVKNMICTMMLANGEECSFDYDIVFVNPFIAKEAEGVKMFGNAAGLNTVETAEQVAVLDKEEDAILSYDGTALTLTEKATDVYKVAAPTVTYAFEQTKEYKDFVAALSAKSELKVGETDGVITWVNEGATLTKNYRFTVIATVTFENLSVVECRIPVTLTAKK